MNRSVCEEGFIHDYISIFIFSFVPVKSDGTVKLKTTVQDGVLQSVWVKPLDIFNETPWYVPAVFVWIKPGILSQSMVFS